MSTKANRHWSVVVVAVWMELLYNGNAFYCLRSAFFLQSFTTKRKIVYVKFSYFACELFMCMRVSVFARATNIYTLHTYIYLYSIQVWRWKILEQHHHNKSNTHQKYCRTHKHTYTRFTVFFSLPVPLLDASVLNGRKEKQHENKK